MQESDFGFVHQVLTFTRYHDESASSTAARENYAFLHARLYARLTYGNYFLNKKEFEQAVAKQMNLFYILLARNAVKNRSIEQFKRQLKILDDLGLKFKTAVFCKKFIREIILQAFRVIGIDLNRISRSDQSFMNNRPGIA